MDNLHALISSLVNRRALDFDLDRQCSVTLATQNVYACLTCGKFLQGTFLLLLLLL